MGFHKSSFLRHNQFRANIEMSHNLLRFKAEIQALLEGK